MSVVLETYPVRPVDVEKAEIELVAKTKAAAVLLVGGDDWALSDVSAQLEADRRKVYRCRDSADAPVPCNAFQPGRGCPLDRDTIDVVLLVRSRSIDESPAKEMGAVCAVRDGLPLVIAGRPGQSMFTPWAIQVAPDGDVVTTCDQAVAADVP